MSQAPPTLTGVLLESIKIRRFRNFVDPAPISIEPDVTALVGKTESGKSTLLHALFRLNPANNGYKRTFDATEDYPRWRLTPDRRNENLSDILPISATFIVEDSELTELAAAMGVPALPSGSRCQMIRDYENRSGIWIRLTVEQAVRCCASVVGPEDADLKPLVTASSLQEIPGLVKQVVTDLEASGETARAAAIKKLPAQIKHYETLVSGAANDEHRKALLARVPKFFYFSNYAILPGAINLTDLLAKDEDDLNESEQTALALLRFAGVSGEEFVDSDIESRKAELEAAAIDLSRQVFEYWKQNEDLTSERLLSRVNVALGVESFDHGLPAAQVAGHRDEFFKDLDGKTLDRFEALFVLLNATLS